MATYTNPYTGISATYDQVTRHKSGLLMDEVLCDGVEYVFVKGKFYKRRNPWPHAAFYNVNDYGVQPGKKGNSLRLTQLINKLGRGIYFAPAGYEDYLLTTLPKEYNNFRGTPTQLHIQTSGVHLQGEEGTVFAFEAGAAGLQVTGGLVHGVFKLSNITLKGPGADANLLDGVVNYTKEFYPDGGRNPDFGREVGTPSLQHLNYQCNGVNAHGIVRLEDVTITGFAHGVDVFGAVRDVPTPRGVPFTLGGRLSPENGGTFRPRIAALAASARFGWEIEVAGQRTLIGNNPVDSIALQGNLGWKASDNVTATITPRGGGLDASGCEFRNCNIFLNKGAGVNISGADANHTRIVGGSIHDNGWHGVRGASFLGEQVQQVMFHFNGTRHNQRDERGNVVSGNVGHVAIGLNDTAHSSARDNYFEADVPPNYVGLNSELSGGFPGSGTVGPGLSQAGRQLRNAILGVAEFDARGVALPYGDQDTYPLLLRQNGRTGLFTFQHGKEEYGQGVRESLALSQQGSPLTSESGEIVGYTAYRGIQAPAVSVGAASIYTFDTLSSCFAQLEQEKKELRAGDTLNISRAEGGPLQYRCLQGGPPGKLLLHATGFGVGPLEKRPPVGQLTVHALGWQWLDPDTHTISYFTGQEWTTPRPL